MYKIINRKRIGYNYELSFNKGADIFIKSDDASNSCGIVELECVGALITNLKAKSFSDEQVADELETVATRMKRGHAAHAMISLTRTELRRPIINILKERGVVVTEYKRNPNSGNYINVIIM